MGLIYDSPALAALTLTRAAAEESEGPGTLEGRMLGYLGDLEQRNGAEYLELVAIALARAHFNAVDDLAAQRARRRLRFWMPRKSKPWKVHRRCPGLRWSGGNHPHHP